MILRLAVMVCLLLAPAFAAGQEGPVRLFAPEALTGTGVMKYILPRFTLKTQVKVTLADAPEGADMVLGNAGRALFEGAGQVWHMQIRSPGHAGTARLGEWLTSEVGRNTVTSFAPGGVAVFTLPEAAAEAVAAQDVSDAAAAQGHAVSRAKCRRCHAVDAESRMSDIGSTPSFAVLRALADWEARFAAFYVLNPHPAFTLIEDVTPPFPRHLPSPIVPVILTLEEVEAVLAYVTLMQAADLGAPLAHQ